MRNLTRCKWCIKTEIERNYHDYEWGSPLFNDDMLFEFLCLEGAQAGLSWITILKKRDNYRAAFDNFDAEKIAHYTESKVEELMQDKGIIRNRLKIRAFVANAKAFLSIKKEYGTFHQYIWSFTNGRTIQNAWTTPEEIPTETPESQAMSKALKQQGFKFVGPTICYAFMQATGMVNDHTTDCYRHQQLSN